MSLIEWTPGEELPPRFWSKVALDPSGCWLWTTCKNNGYGVFHINHRQSRSHRLAYISLVGAIPEGLQLDHLCRVRNCVNPDHLEPVTRKENILRGEGFAAKNARQTHCINGHKFTPENTRNITQDGGRFVLRQCRTCLRLNMRRHNAKVRAAKLGDAA